MTRKNKKAQSSSVMENEDTGTPLIVWIILFLILLFALYGLFRKLGVSV